jgi:DNA mismatch repair protein MutL
MKEVSVAILAQADPYSDEAVRVTPLTKTQRIQQLPPSVVTKIAAGEVIERPASVVKELLENALDAGSTRIDVEVEAGGVERIHVADNGWGIAAEDLPLAFASHATSKLSTADDLFRIATLGFRGEALASIGGVAQVTLQSRRGGDAHGCMLTCHGGDLSPAKAWNGAAGTRVEVRHLFYNTPVRRKFLRSNATEMGHVSEAFTRLALSHPDVHWTLRHNGKLVYEVPTTAGLPDRIGLFFGGEVRNGLYAVEAPQGPVTLRGFVADPSCERGNARCQYLFVNGRWVRDRSLAHALQEAYRGLLMTGRYAVSFLFLEVPPDQVDVNVHPTKAEVRFRDGHALYHLVFAAVRERLRAANLTPRLQVPATPPSTTEAPWSLSAPLPAGANLPFTAAMAPNPPLPLVGEGGARQGGAASSASFSPPPQGGEGPGVGEFSAEAERRAPDSFKAIQLYDAYLVVETPEGMLVIDQHALHERILFEQLKARIRSGPLETQRLLIPEPVELSADQAAHTLEHRAALAELGLEVDDFGGGTVLLTSYPAILGRRSPGDILRAVVDYLVSKDRPPSREVLLNDLLSLMACHAAVKAGDHLTPEAISTLVAQRSLADNTHHCPHGRPTALLFSKHELERQFRRV